MLPKLKDVLLILYREWKQWLSKAELLSGVLVPLIYVVAVLPHYPRHAGFPSRTTIEHLTNAIAFSSATLLSISGYASKLSRRNNGSQSEDLPKLDNMQVTLSTTLRAFGVLLPFFAASELGGVTVAFSLLLVASSDLGGLLSRVPDQSTLRTVWKYKFTLAMILLATLFHYAYLSPANEHSPSIWGYLALYASIFVLPSPILPLPPKLTLDFATSRFLIWGPPPIPPTSSGMPFASPLIKTSDEIEVSKTAGYALAAAWTILIVFLHGISRAWADGILTLGLGTVGIVVSALRARPEYLRTRRKKGVAAGCGFVAISGLFLNPGSWAVSFLFAGLVGLAYAATLFDGSDPIWRPSKKTNGKHDHAHDHSKLTGYLLSLTTPGYVLHTILLERDSRRIAYFGW
jgi:hypothetical protein